MATELYLIRHGEPLFPNGEGIYMGRSQDFPLSAEGKKQAEAAAGKLKDKGITHIFTSPAKRCLETAKPLAERLGIEPVVLEDLFELDPGEWAGRSINEVRAEYGEAFQNGTCFPPPGGESDASGLIRAARALREAERAGGNAALFSHAGLMRLMLSMMTFAPTTERHLFNVRYATPLQVTLTEDGRYVPEKACYRTDVKR